MRLPLYQIDAFAAAPFAGNPAAVCPLETWLDDARMQAVAAENNLAETAFFVREGDVYRLRWFTPTVEVELCGHATLASARVVFDRIEPDTAAVRFATRSGVLTVTRDGDRLVLDFPALPATPQPAPVDLLAGLRSTPSEVWKASNWMAVFDRAEDIRALAPDMAALARLAPAAVIATAPAGADDGCDFVSRFFAPAHGVPEDPATGSAHCTLTPYWARRLGRTRLHARQISHRGGELFCEDRGGRVSIAGRTVLYLEGTIIV
jgi:PhzF family phenazine biosynthesis protein